jgi:hypothetical protein
VDVSSEAQAPRSNSEKEKSRQLNLRMIDLLATGRPCNADPSRWQIRAPQNTFEQVLSSVHHHTQRDKDIDRSVDDHPSKAQTELAHLKERPHN